MDLVTEQRYTAHDSRSLLLSPQPPISSPIFQRTSSSGTSFPIIAVAVIGILATAFLLVGYYVFVIKCCLNWHRIDLLRRFSLSRRRNDQDPPMAYSPGLLENRGLDESAIRSIPIFKFKKKGGSGSGSRDFGERNYYNECAVCLNEFQEDEKLRIIPNCSHVFHIDCIDIWLQNNANCPLCRTSVSSNAMRLPIGQIPAPSSSPEDRNPYSETIVRGEEDFVVIELGRTNDNPMEQTLLRVQERLNSAEVSGPTHAISPSLRKMNRGGALKKGRKFDKVTSMGDECIDIRGKDDQFGVQPIRRSFSMDSSADRQLYLAVQEAMQRQNRQVAIGDVGGIEGCSSSGSSRAKRSFFSFGSGRGSRSAVLPLYLEP